MFALIFDAYLNKKATDLAFLKCGLENQGYNLLFVGGCVRDAFLKGLTPDDLDLAASADVVE